MTSTAKPELVKVKSEIQRLTVPVVVECKDFQITDTATYQDADSLRVRIKHTKKSIEDRLEVIIRPAYETLQALYSFKRELIAPLETSDVMITDRMKAYKRAELQKIQREVEEKLKEQAEAARRIEEAERKAAVARSAGAKRAFEAIAEREAEKLEEMEEEPVEAAAVAIGSTIRTVKVWKIADMLEFVNGVAAGIIPLDTLQVNEVVFNAYFRGDTPNKTTVSKWPGVVVDDDVQIVSRRGR